MRRSCVTRAASRTSSEEKQLEELQAFELELTELRDALLTIAPNYHPNHDDGVQITAAPVMAAIPPQALAESAERYLDQARKG